MKKRYLLFSLFAICFAIGTNASGLEKKGQLLMAQNQQIGFTENKGQITDGQGNPATNVLYSYTVNGMDVFITTTGISYVFSTDSQENNSGIQNAGVMKDSKVFNSNVNYHRTDMVLEGATIQKNQIKASKESSKLNSTYYNASNLKGIKDIKTWQEITIANIYPGIDWVLYIDEASQYAMEYDFVVRPGANAQDIQMLYKGAGITLSQGNTMINIETGLGNIREGNLLSYQGTIKNKVASTYVLQNNEISFAIGDYNSKETLTIDPPILIWSTNFGGTKTEYLNDVVVDDQDNLYILGLTRSPNLPGVIGGSTYKASYDAFVVKFDAVGQLKWSSYFGGTGNDDTDGGIAINNTTHEVYFCGTSPSADFPILSVEGAYNHSTIEGGNNGYVTKISSEGALLWSTFIGGDGYDYLRDLSIDANNQLFVMGFTSSTDFPIVALEGAYNEPVNHGGMNEGVLLKFNENDQLTWSTYFGGDNVDQMAMIKIDHNNHLFIVGNTSSKDFPIVEKAGAYNNPVFVNVDYNQAVIMEFDEASKMIWSTFFGGTRTEFARAIGWDAANNIYVVGETESDDMPTLELPGAYYCSELGNEVLPYISDGFILRFDTNGALDWSTYYGGNDSDIVTDIAFDEQGNMWLCGATSSQNFQVKELEGAFNQSTFAAGNRVMFWSMFNTAKTLDWSTFYGCDDFGWASNFVKRSGNRLMLFSQASSDAGLSSGLIANNPLSYQQGNITSNDIVILEFITGSGVGVENNQIDNNVSVFPNPVNSGNLHINSLAPITNVELINAAGQIVQSIHCNSNEIQVNINNLETGIYVVRIQTSDNVISKKVQIVK